MNIGSSITELKNRLWLKVCAAAACLCIVVAGTVLLCVSKSPKSEMSFERIMQLKHIQMSTEWMIFENLEDSESYFKRFGYSLISGTVTDVSYYAVWKDDETAMYGYSVVEFRVDQVDEENNNLHLNPNDTVSFRDMNYISFRKRTELDKYASENAERVIVGDEIKTIELIPETGGDYSRSTFENCPPMKIGERYTLMCVKSSDTGRYWGEYALPVDSGFLKDCTEKYGYSYPKDILSIAGEIQDKFITESDPTSVQTAAPEPTDDSVSAPVSAPEPTTEPDPPQPMSPPAQPIAFESYDDILRFIRNYDGTGDSCPEAKDYWPEEFVAAYLKMVDSYKSDGFFYEITDSEGLKKEAYTLYPDVTYEDIGIRVCLVDGEDWYQCIIYTTRDNARIMGDGHSLYDYMKDRMGLKKDIRDENSDREILRYINSDPENGYSSYIETPIDETHYLCIRTRASGDDVYEKMCDLYESLSFTKRTIQQ